jgi:hypothetical protein
MKIYGLVLAALTVVIFGGKMLHAGWSGQAASNQDTTTDAKPISSTERELLLRWQQNRANHWRAYVMQQP